MPIINKKTGKRDFVAERLAESPARKKARANEIRLVVRWVLRMGMVR